jgi:hypothetical protein
VSHRAVHRRRGPGGPARGRGEPSVAIRRRLPPPAGLAGAVVVAAVLSGVPSSLHALATRRSLLASTRAAGTLLGGSTVPRGAAAHVLLSTGWTTVIATVLPRRRPIAGGALLGAGIGALDLTLARRWFPAIARLPMWPQLADHVAFGALAAAAIERERR